MSSVRTEQTVDCRLSTVAMIRIIKINQPKSQLGQFKPGSSQSKKTRLGDRTRLCMAADP